jgi:hypothetical protein
VLKWSRAFAFQKFPYYFVSYFIIENEITFYVHAGENLSIEERRSFFKLWCLKYSWNPIDTHPYFCRWDFFILQLSFCCYCVVKSAYESNVCYLWQTVVYTSAISVSMYEQSEGKLILITQIQISMIWPI